MIALVVPALARAQSSVTVQLSPEGDMLAQQLGVSATDLAAQIKGRGSNNGSPGTARILAGVQLNLWKLKVFGQVNASQAPAASIAFGLKFVQ